MKIWSGILAGTLAVLASQSVHAADIAGGLSTARTLCVNCHIVEPGVTSRDPMTAGIPSFEAIARKSGQTEAALKAFMLKPHAPMPQVQLTTYELDNLARYILSLKD
jgi:cytochrome c